MIHRILTMRRITRSITYKHTIKMRRYLMDREIVRENRHTRTTAHKRTQDILFNAAVYDCHMCIPQRRGNVERRLGANPLDEVELLRVSEGFVLVGVVFFTYRDAC